MSFRSRHLEAELMDDPGLDPAVHRRALAGLVRLNAWSGSVNILWPSIRDLARSGNGRSIRILDVATGAGDVPIGLWRLAARAGIPVEIHGCDLSPVAVAEAEERARTAGAAVTFFRHDALREPLPRGFDVVTCSLFLHHLSETDAVTLLAALGRAAGRLVLVNDLARGQWNLALVWLATRLLTRSPVVRADGPLSVRAAFTPAEALRLADQAGLAGATVRRRWPCRFLLSWRRDE
jgi:2-polyprenyl-3-methyl-5-hydroxy-6-metoxy-1,4-benzoquinol methylase